MKVFFYSVLCLIAVVVIAGAIGYGPTRTQWGHDGVDSMIAMAVICLSAAVVAALPIGFVAPRWPSYIGQAVMAGTTIRLLLTAALGYGYQRFAEPHLGSYLMWAGIFYLLLLAVETSFGVVAVRRYYVTQPKTGGAPA